MKYAIITPTYKNHFQFIPKYLESFDKFVEDKKEIPIFFTISQTENSEFEKIIKNYKEDLNIHVLFIEDLFKENNISLTPDEYLKQFGRFTFQTAKKFYSMLHADAEKFLVLDCESMWIKPTNMTQLFNDYFKNPFFVTSEIENENRKDEFFNQMLENIVYLSGCEKKWYIEHFMWYYDKQILKNMFLELGDLNSLIEKLKKQNTNQKNIDRKTGIFEIVLYYAYLDMNQEKYGYKEISIDELLKKYLDENLLEDYKYNFYKKFKSTSGVTEHCLMLLSEDNIEALANMFKAAGLNIIRCEKSDIENFNLQKRFIEIVQPNILAASQEHAFGISNKIDILCNKNKYYYKLLKHFTQLIHPYKFSFYLFIEPFAVIKYFLKWIMLSNKNKKIYKKYYQS